MTSLCIGGGSYKGFCFLGALDYLYKKNYLTLLKNFYGTSIGAIIGVLFIIGIKPLVILDFFLKIDFNELWDFDIKNLTNSYSLLSNKLFKNHLIFLFQKYEDINISIKDFIKKYEINVNIYATSLKKRELINFNTKEYENIKIIDALQASASIPIIFPPVLINNEYFVDGCCKSLDGVLNYIDDGYTIRFNFDYTEISNLTDYITELISTGATSKKKIKSNINTLEINLPNHFKKKYNFNDIKNSDKIELFYEGLIQAQKFYL